MSDFISPSFRWTEFASHDGRQVPSGYQPAVIELVMTLLQPMRQRYGPITIVSGWRSADWNRRVGGAKDSAHLKGKAADIRTKLLGPQELHEDILSIYKELFPALGGLGAYSGWVHVDIAKPADGHLRRWRGDGVGSERP